MFVKYAVIEITQSLMSSRRQHQYAWAVPVLVMAHGPTNVKIFGYEWIEKDDSQTEMQKLTANAEYERLRQILDDGGNSVVTQVFGPPMMVPQTLEPIMRDSVIIGTTAPISCPPVSGYEPNAEDPLLTRRMRERNDDGTIPGFVGQTAEQHDAGDPEAPVITPADSSDLKLNPKGYVRKSDVVDVMGALGMEADEALNTEQLKNTFGDVLAGMCQSTEVASEEEGLWGAGEAFTDEQLVEMFDRLQMAGHLPLVREAA